MEKSAERLKVLERIAELERQGLWHIDVEDDPVTLPLMPDGVDYLNEKVSSRIKTFFANIMATRFFDKMIKNRQLIITEIRGIENFTAVGAEGLSPVIIFRCATITRCGSRFAIMWTAESFTR